MKQLSTTDELLWQNLVEKHKAFGLASRDFLADSADRVAVLRNALRGRDRSTALMVATSLKPDELQELIGPLMFLASFSHGSIGAVRELICSLPRTWLLNNIEREAEPYLHDGTYDEYRRFLELYELLDASMMHRLARRAAAQSDPDIREAGEDFLVKCEPAANGVTP
jgi:hypothetical protein